MSSSINFSKLKNYKNEILKAEIGSLLFNLGKTHIGFWRKKESSVFFGDIDENSFKNTYGFGLFGDYKSYYDKGIFEKELEKYNLKDFITSQEVKLPFETLKWIEFFKGNASNEELIKKIFFRGCENINSGIDKGAPNRQLKPPLWLSNAFGTFKRKIDEKDFDQKRQCFFYSLNDFLEENNYKNCPNWKKIRNFVLKEIKRWYSKLLSDSRFPINDVTLWDQAYITATMFKATLAGMILEDTKYNEYIQDPTKIRWSILGVQYDKLGLAEKSLKVRGIQWYRETSKKVDEKIKELIEVEYPLGNEIYRDETGIYFLVPENIIGNKFFEDEKLFELHENLNKIKDEILNIFKEEFKDEIYPAIVLTKPSRGLMNLGYLLEKAKDNFLKVDWSKKDADLCLEYADKGRAKGTCQICRMRLVFDDNKKEKDFKNYCNICYERIKGRVKNWYENRDKETIWIDELKDKNGRIALVTLKFELQEWLNGNMLNSLLIRDEDFGVYLNIIMNILRTIKNKFQITDLDNLSISQNEEDNFKNFLKLFDKDGIQEPYNKIIDKLKDKGDIGQIDRDSQDLAERLIISENIKNFDFIQNKDENELHKLKAYINSQSLNIFQKEGNKVKINKNKNIRKKIKNKLWIIFALNYIYLQIRGLLLERSIGHEWEEFIYKGLNDWDDNQKKPKKQKIDFDNRQIYWNRLTDQDIKFLATLLLQFLLRKNPSPARLRRVWESTKEFFKDLENKIEILAEIPEWRKKRIVLEIDKTLNEGEYESNGVLFYVFKEEPKELYLISSIEEFLSKFGNNEIKKLLEDKNKPENVEKLNEILSDENKLKKNIIKEFSLNYYNNKEIIESVKIKDIKIESYKPYFSIIETTPISWQFIIPSEYLPNLIENIQKEYFKNFKWVYGKLALHIGVIVQNYKSPLYIGILSLRRIRRDNTNWENLRKEIYEKELKDKQEDIYSNYETDEELINNTEMYYSLYELKDSEGEYQFYIYPKIDGKYWISTTKENENRTLYYYPNTFDFEFLDSNIRREDIFYCKGRRILPRKSNRPYNLEDWMKFKIFYNSFKDKPSKIQKLIDILLSNLDKILELEENMSVKKFVYSSFVNILDLKKDKGLLKNISSILFDKELNNLEEFENKFINDIDKNKLLMIIDMFEFWHTSLKEI